MINGYGCSMLTVIEVTTITVNSVIIKEEHYVHIMFELRSEIYQEARAIKSELE